MGTLHESLPPRSSISRLPGVIPPHTTFTTCASSLVGVNFTSLEGLPMMSLSLRAHWLSLPATKGVLEGDMTVYLAVITAWLTDGCDPDVI